MALCVSSLHDAGAALCLLQTSPESGAATVLAAEVDEAWTRCEPKRADGPPLSLQIDASVPGDLLTDLQNAGQIGDPLVEKNFLNSSLWAARTWTYSTTFTAPAAWRCERLAAALRAPGHLVCPGHLVRRPFLVERPIRLLPSPCGYARHTSAIPYGGSLRE